ncbi:hypothetical protein D3C73_470680 [compost metagenome]
MDIHKFTRRRLEKLYSQSHENAMEYIDIITNAAMDQMKIDGVNLDPHNIDIPLICKMAAKHLNANYQDILHDYTDVMVFEGMISIEKSSTSSM